MDWLKVCKEIGRELRYEIMPLCGSRKAGELVRVKDDGDKVKKIDVVAENKILEILGSVDESFTLVSEELGRRNFGKKPEFEVVVDPLDGSGNAVRGIPFFSTSIAVFKSERQILGYVNDLFRRDNFWADDNGAFRNGQPVKIKGKSDMYYLSFYLHPNRKVALPRTEKILMDEQIVPRYFGSVALDLCWVAINILHGVVDLRQCCRFHDYAAGKMILEEAGGIVTDSKGNPLKRETTDLIAAGKDLHKRLMELVDYANEL